MLSPVQLLAARAILEWTREDLAKASGTSIETIKGFEWGGRDPKFGTVLKWRSALQAAGVAFIDDDGEQGPGVRLRESETRRQERITRSLNRLGFELGKGRGGAFRITAAGGSAVPDTTDTMTLDQIERWIGDHIKPNR